MSLSFRVVRRLPGSGFTHHNTRTFGRLLGPCFKTGGMRSFQRQACTPKLAPRMRRARRRVLRMRPRRDAPSLHGAAHAPAGVAHSGCSSAFVRSQRRPAQLPRDQPSPQVNWLAERLGTPEACLSHAELAPSVRRGVPCPYRPTISSPFNSLFKVLFIFRSHYLFAVGLRAIFSLR